MRVPVSREGIVVPKSFLGNAREVEILTNGDVIEIILNPKDDPIFELGQDPITDLNITDASINHDKYIYDPNH
jgi:hypothetical protein